MKVKLVEKPESELEIQITYPEWNVQIQKLVNKIESLKPKILVSNDSGNRMLALEEIYYAESVERKTFLYTAHEVYRCSKKVYELTKEWESYGFIQIGKALLVNMEALIEVKPLWNSRLEGTLENGEKVIIARTYIKRVKEWLEKEEA